MVIVSEMDLEWYKSHLALAFYAWSARVGLHWPANGRRGRGKGCMWGRRDGGRSWEQTVLPRDVQMHRLAYTTVPCNPPHKWSISSIYDCSIFAVPDPFVCLWRVWLWSLGISAQTNTFICSHVGNQQSAGWSKGNPLFKEGFTVFISSWTTVDVLNIIFKLKVNNKFSIRIHIQMN